jgi:hypothetical protein
MNKNLIITLVCSLGLFVILGLVCMITNISLENKNVRQQEAIKAQQKSNEANFDKMFKTIAQVAEVAEHKMIESKEAFKEIYPALIEGRYSSDSDGSLMKWIQESNPTFDIASAANLYDELVVVIESNRKEFFIEQQKLIDLKRENDVLLNTFPGTWFLDSDPIEITIIESSYTKEVFATGEENDIKIY